VPPSIRLLRPRALLSFALLIAGVALIFPWAAQAQTCSEGTGSYGSNERRQLPLNYTYKSVWNSDWTYNANREDSGGAITYHAYVETQDNLREWTFTNSVDVYRRTVIIRGGYGSALWYMRQEAMGSC
jgi:hypothetical protein